MIKIIVSIRDNVAEIFNDPRVEINVQSAIRAFTETIKDHPHKDDFTMYQIGAMDTNTGDILANEPIKLITGMDVKTNNVSSITPEMQIEDLAKHELLKKQSGDK